VVPLFNSIATGPVVASSGVSTFTCAEPTKAIYAGLPLTVTPIRT
jgi:hypothetical protein